MKFVLKQNISNLELDSIFPSEWCKGKPWYISTDRGFESGYLHEDGTLHTSTEPKQSSLISGYYKYPIKAISTFAKYRPNDELDISNAVIPQTVEEFIQLYYPNDSTKYDLNDNRNYYSSILNIMAQISLGEIAPSRFQGYQDIIVLMAKATMALLYPSRISPGSMVGLSPRNIEGVLERSSSHLENILKGKS